MKRTQNSGSRLWACAAAYGMLASVNGAMITQLPGHEDIETSSFFPKFLGQNVLPWEMPVHNNLNLAQHSNSHSSTHSSVTSVHTPTVSSVSSHHTSSSHADPDPDPPAPTTQRYTYNYADGT